MLVPEKPASWQIGLILTVGILAISTAAILVRLTIAAAQLQGIGFSLVMAAARLSLAALMLVPTWRSLPRQLPPTALWQAGAAGLLLAVHFASWITSLSYTTIAASTTIVTTSPIWVSLLSWLWFRELPTRLTAIGGIIALSGGIAIGFADVEALPGHNSVLGNGLALVGAWAASLYFLLGRQAQSQGLGIGHYAAIAYSTAAIVLLPLPWLFGTGYYGYAPGVYLWLGLMALLPQLVGHTCINWSVRWLSPTLVTLAILFEPVGSSLLGYLIFNEMPGEQMLAGAGVLLVGVAMAAVGTRTSP